MGSIHRVDYFTFFYCQKHMCGCVLLGDHENVPEWHTMCGRNSNCDWTWWIKNGLISFDELNVEVIDAPIDFSVRDCGGFEFNYHINEFYDEHGAFVLSESPLKLWIENYSTN